MSTRYSFIDVHGFAGGFSCAATRSGMRLVAKREGPGGFGVPLMEANRKFLGDDWQSQVSEPEAWDVVKADVVLGTPPCTGFSNMSVGTKQHGIDAPINHCMWDLMRYAARVKPAVLLMESVPGAFTRGRPLMRALAEELNRLTGLAYRTTHVLQNNLSTGGATNRKRYFLVLSQVPFGVEHRKITRLPTVGDAIGDLKDLALTPDDQPIFDRGTWWSREMWRWDRRVDGHFTPQVKVDRIGDLVRGDRGVQWHGGERVSTVVRRHYEVNGSLPDSWQYEYKGRKANREDGPITREQQLKARGFEMGGFNQLRKWSWDQPGSVISGAGPYMIWHPNDRYATHREVARLMGFPDAWVVGSAKDDKSLSLFWGKGTSVHPAEWLTDWVS